MKKVLKIMLCVLSLVIITACVQESKEKKPRQKPMKITKEAFGKADTTEVYLYTLTNNNGMTVKITNYGGIITSILAPGKDGKLADVVLGFDELQPYLDGHPYFGCIVGRYGNRIADGRFSIDGEDYTLAANNGPNHLHGGVKGFDKVVWDAKEKSSSDSASLRLRYTSQDGEEGYPGNLRIMVTYTLTGNNELIVDYKATTDKPTPVNLTHHSYFNLGGSQENALDHILTIAADKYVVVDETLIPTGELASLDNSVMDFRKGNSIGSRIAEVEGGYDHTYVLFNMGNMLKVADVYHPKSGRALEVYTSEPGIQFYSGNFLDGSLTGKNDIVYHKHHGFCLETQHFPDSPNQPGFPNTILRPGEEYGYTTIYKFLTK
ncbi:MAG: aldose epimerase family protein [Bacteroidota bacterium]